MNNRKRILFFALLLVLGLGFFFGCYFNQSDFITLQIWHYYNGTQKIAFDEMVNEFNDTEGFEKGIFIEALNQGNIGSLEKEIQESIEKRVGCQNLPDIVIVYPDMALMMDDEDLLIDQSKYLMDKDIELYMDSYIEEGYLTESSGLKLFPIAKATEILMVNKTDWEKFSRATKADLEDLKTWEGITKTAEDYYNWTKNQKDSQGVGKSFFGRDAMSNYMIIGAKQLGEEIFQLEDGEVSINMDRVVMRKLWDNFYTPYVKGYFVSHGRFSSDDAKVGDIIALVGSTTGAAYFPDTVTIDDNSSYEIESLMLPLPTFEGGKHIAIQQGAGAAVIKSDLGKEKAALDFLKWFTDSTRNIRFSSITGYLPVTKISNDLVKYKEQIYEDAVVPTQIKEALIVAMEQMSEYELHISRPFKNSIKARDCLPLALTEKAENDRKEVLRLIESGDTYDAAIDKVISDEDFEKWFWELKDRLEYITSLQ